MTVPLGPSSEIQKTFLNVDATVVVYGGSRGAGKTYVGILRHLRFCQDPKYVGYIIRRNETMLKSDGGAFNEAVELCRRFCPDIKVTSKPMRIKFPWGATISFRGYEDDKASDNYRGLQISAAMIDEGNQLKEDHIWMLLSCLRSEAKMDGNIWITCNPDPDSYLARWVDWYLYPKDHPLGGRVDPDKSGRIRYFIRCGEETLWDEDKETLVERVKTTYGIKNPKPLSFTFIGGNIYSNPLLIKNNPMYLANLESLRRVAKERDLYGNWYVREEEAGYFKREWLGEPLRTPPKDVNNRVRAWDLAGSIPSETNSNPDWTVGVLMSKDTNGKYCIEHVERFRARHGEVLDRIVEVARRDGDDVTIIIPKDAGQAGATAAAYHVGVLAEQGFKCKVQGTSKSKLKRFEPASCSMEVGNFTIVQGDWNEPFFDELEAFDGLASSRTKKDDQVDGVSDGFAVLSTMRRVPLFSLPELRQANRFA